MISSILSNMMLLSGGSGEQGVGGAERGSCEIKDQPRLINKSIGFLTRKTTIFIFCPFHLYMTVSLFRRNVIEVLLLN